MDAKADGAPSELVHDDEDPMTLHQNGFTPKQVNTPEAVLRVPDKCKPRRSVVIRIRAVVLFKHAPDNIFIDGYSKCFVDLLRYSAASKAGIVLLQFDDSLDEIP